MIDYPKEFFEQEKMKLNEKDFEELRKIEEKEYEYLEKYYHFFKAFESELIEGLKTQNRIKKDWIKEWTRSKSDLDKGAERIIYHLFNTRHLGRPNSSPVGSDLFLELKEVFVHIDVKTVQTNNIGDFNNSIFIGLNQHSYDSDLKFGNGKSRKHKPSLPYEYTVVDKDTGKKIKKVCLTYFLSILYEKDSLEVLCIVLSCMPNGKLKKVYKHYPLKAGKRNEDARFNFVKVPYFEMLSKDSDKKVRTKVIYLKDGMKKYKKSLEFFHKIQSYT